MQSGRRACLGDLSYESVGCGWRRRPGLASESKQIDGFERQFLCKGAKAAESVRFQAIPIGSSLNILPHFDLKGTGHYSEVGRSAGGHYAARHRVAAPTTR